MKRKIVYTPQEKAKRTRAIRRALEQAREAMYVAGTTKVGLPEAIARYVAVRLRQKW